MSLIKHNAANMEKIAFIYKIQAHAVSITLLMKFLVIMGPNANITNQVNANLNILKIPIIKRNNNKGNSILMTIIIMKMIMTNFMRMIIKMTMIMNIIIIIVRNKNK